MNFNAETQRTQRNAKFSFCRQLNFIFPLCGTLRSRHLCVSFLFLLAISTAAAEEFGDVSVDANAIYTGNTFHGYAEMRVNLENHSSSKTHVVTLVYPNNDYGNYGNNISRLSRSVKLEPGAREVVSLLQPPLPAQGDGSIRVEVDNRREGEVRAPNANNHCNYYSRGAGGDGARQPQPGFRRGRASVSGEPRGVHGGDGDWSAGCQRRRLPAHNLDAGHAARWPELAGARLRDAATSNEHHGLQHAIANLRRLDHTNRHFGNQSRQHCDVVRQKQFQRPRLDHRV
jgi:hypothetical protein